MNGRGRLKRLGLWAGVVVGLLVVGGLVFWTTRPVGIDIDPDDYKGVVPPGVKLEDYPRLVPWVLVSITDEGGATVLRFYAQSHACVTEVAGKFLTETFDHLNVHETADTVTIETWLGPPEEEGFWPDCEAVGWGFSVQVKLESPLGSRELVDPACELQRYAHWIACKESKLIRIP